MTRCSTTTCPRIHRLKRLYPTYASFHTQQKGLQCLHFWNNQSIAELIPTCLEGTRWEHRPNAAHWSILCFSKRGRGIFSAALLSLDQYSHSTCLRGWHWTRLFRQCKMCGLSQRLCSSSLDQIQPCTMHSTLMLICHCLHDEVPQVCVVFQCTCNWFRILVIKSVGLKYQLLQNGICCQEVCDESASTGCDSIGRKINALQFARPSSHDGTQHIMPINVVTTTSIQFDFLIVGCSLIVSQSRWMSSLLPKHRLWLP